MSLASALLLLTVTFFGHAQSNLDPHSQEITDALVKAHSGWNKLSSPNASIQAKEVTRQGSVVQYHLFVKGLPTDALYTSYQWPVGAAKPAPVMEGITIGTDGLLMCAGRKPEQCGDPNKKDDPIEFTFSPAKGEPYRLAFASSDAQVTTVVVPDPIEGKDKGCTLNVVRLLPKFELAYFSGNGFLASSEVQFDTQSYDEKHLITIKTGADGNLRFAILPAVSGHSKGTTSVKVLGKECTLSLKFDWGN